MIYFVLFGKPFIYIFYGVSQTLYMFQRHLSCSPHFFRLNKRRGVLYVWLSLLINPFLYSIFKILYVMWVYENYRCFLQKYETLKLDIKCWTVGFTVIKKCNEIQITMQGQMELQGLGFRVYLFSSTVSTVSQYI